MNICSDIYVMMEHNQRGKEYAILVATNNLDDGKRFFEEHAGIKSDEWQDVLENEFWQVVRPDITYTIQLVHCLAGEAA